MFAPVAGWGVPVCVQDFVITFSSKLKKRVLHNRAFTNGDRRAVTSGSSIREQARTCVCLYLSEDFDSFLQP